MDEKRQMLHHFLAALAYRTQKALRGAPPHFSSFRAGHNVRTPHELIRHMDGVLGYARTYFIGGTYRPPEFTDFTDAVVHFRRPMKTGSPELQNSVSVTQLMNSPGTGKIGR